MDSPVDTAKLIVQIGSMAREIGIKPYQVAEFKKLFLFYTAMEASTAAEPKSETAAFARDEAAFPIDTLVERHASAQEIARTKYEQNTSYYLLLKSFYNAFIAPVEQDLSIVESCRALDIQSLELASATTTSPLRLKTYNRDEANLALVQAREAFENLGRIFFPATFDRNDFTTADQG